MGVDISLFAKKSERYLKCDRAWVCSVWDSEDPLLLDLADKFRNSLEGLNAESTLYYLNECLKLNSNEEDLDRKEYKIHWLSSMMVFVKRHLDDTFFILSDCNDQYFDDCDQYEEELL